MAFYCSLSSLSFEKIHCDYEKTHSPLTSPTLLASSSTKQPRQLEVL